MKELIKSYKTYLNESVGVDIHNILLGSISYIEVLVNGIQLFI